MVFAPFDLRGKKALITGGNSGIGLGFAEGLAQAGADVAIWGTNVEKNEKAKAHLDQFGTHIIALKCDVSDKDAVVESFAKSVERLGRVDACFANAGIGGRGTLFKDMTQEEWHEVFRVNMDGVFYTFQEAIKHMIKGGHGGSLVATSSGAAIFGAPRNEHYSSIKAGLNSMVRGLAVEYARYGIRANAIAPGWIETALTERAVNNEIFQQKVLTRIPIGRWGRPADFSGLAVYLASDASAYHSGDVLIIDGGFAAF